MNYEESRLQTFNNWPPTAEVEPFRIAKAGFYFVGQGVEVQCFRCGGKISEWNCGDQVMARHRRLDPKCPFVVNPATSGNVPILPHTDSSNQVNPPLSTSSPSQESNNSPQQPTNDLEMNSDEIYKNDALRLLSFVNWPISFISRESLALAGFYYIGSRRGAAADKVRCAWCTGELERWQNGDHPISEHLRHYPNCQYAKDKSKSSNRVDSTAPQISNNDLLIQNNMTELGVQAHTVLKNHRYFSNESRLRTYATWPSNHPQTPTALATAGFYYTGRDDKVRCFHCNGGLQSWLPTDDPWTEHAKWFPNCGFVTLVKGITFVETCSTEETNTNSRRVWAVRDDDVDHYMSSTSVAEALRLGLQPDRVRRAIRVRLHETGMPFASTDALIDATLNEQLNEMSFTGVEQQRSYWEQPSAARHGLHYRVDEAALDQVTRRIIDSALSEGDTHLSSALIRDTLSEVASDDAETIVNSAIPLAPLRECVTDNSGEHSLTHKDVPADDKLNKTSSGSAVSLEEENRLLKEARACKICMDDEVGVVFLPCGHLVSCVTCAPCLAQCPLCRASVKGVVRTYLS